MKRRIRVTAIRFERGQSLPLIALIMVVLLAFIGLTVDLGILLITHGHLRRAVDSAALSASAQFREGRGISELTAAATEFIALNGVNPATVTVDTCDTDASLCTNPRRKLVRVTATANVNFVFLPIVNFNSTTIRAEAISEAASVDVVLALDTSDSMTFDAVPGDPLRDPAICNAADPFGTDVGGPDGDGPDGFPGECHPFEEVKKAAVAFLSGSVYTPYDRIAIVTFAQVPVLWQPITSTATITDTINLVKGLQVSLPPSLPPSTTCTYPPDPSGCTNTSIGGGLKLAGNEFGRAPVRQDSLWVVILLTDGAANASEPAPGGTPINRFCPSTTWTQPFCRDGLASTRHGEVIGDTYNYFGQDHFYNPADYDSDDYARDMADFVGCLTVTDYGANPVPHDCSTAHQGASWTGGQGAVIYTIGLGPLVTNNTTGGEPDAAERTLRYAVAVGDDGDPLTDPCYDPNNNHTPAGVDPNGTSDDIAIGLNCGNYYYGATGNQLIPIFESIASRIFTRITH